MPFNKTLLSTTLATLISSMMLTGCGSESSKNDSPKKEVTGFATQVAKDPLIAKTSKIAKIDQLLSIPQRCFNFSIDEKLYSKKRPKKTTCLFLHNIKINKNETKVAF